MNVDTFDPLDTFDDFFRKRAYRLKGIETLIRKRKRAVRKITKKIKKLKRRRKIQKNLRNAQLLNMETFLRTTEKSADKWETKVAAKRIAETLEKSEPKIVEIEFEISELETKLEEAKDRLKWAKSKKKFEKEIEIGL